MSLDVGVGPHRGVDLGRGALDVGVGAPVPELYAPEEAPLSTGAKRLAPDEAGCPKAAWGHR